MHDKQGQRDQPIKWPTGQTMWELFIVLAALAMLLLFIARANGPHI